MRKYLLVFSILFGIIELKADDYPKQTDIDILNYNVSLKISDNNDSIYGLNEITFKQLAPIIEIWFDIMPSMKITEVQFNDNNASYKVIDNRVKINCEPNSNTKNQIIAIRYKGIPKDGLIISENKYGDRTFFGDNWPNRAHHWFPCIDHPYEKATVTFSITAPTHYLVVANGKLKETSRVDSLNSLTVYECLNPIPTKVMVFGAADFATQHLVSRNGNNVQSWVYYNDKENGFYDYAIATEILDFFEDRLGDFPYAKLANVQSKTRYGGMENAGCIFYHEGSVTGKRDAEELIAHEIVHQWFGNTASEKNWEDIWLSEGFATYLTGLYLKETYGNEAFTEYMKKAFDKVYLFNTKAPSTSVIPTNLENLNAILNPMTYQKAAWCLYMISEYYFEGDNWTWMKSYYEKFKFSNASTDNLFDLIPDNKGISKSDFKKQWLTQSTLPSLRYSYQYNEKYKEVTVNIKQLQKSKTPFMLPIEIGVLYTTSLSFETQQYIVTEKNRKIVIPVSEKPQEIKVDPFFKLLLKVEIQDL